MNNCKALILTIVLILLFSLTACNNTQAPSEAPAPSQVGDLPVYEDSSSEDIAPFEGPSLPELEPPADKPSVDVAALLGTATELDYKAETPVPTFLEALAQAYKDQANVLRDKTNFFEIGGYILYYNSDSAVGPGRVAIIHPNGEVEVFLESAQPIFEMDITGEAELVLQIATYVDEEGFEGHYYTYDLTNRMLSPVPGGETADTFEERHVWYAGQHYRVSKNDRADILDEAQDIYVYNNGFKPLIENTPGHSMAGGKLYYLSSDGLTLHSCNPDGSGKQVVRTFDSTVLDIEVSGRILRAAFEDDDGHYDIRFIDMTAGKELPVENPGQYRSRIIYTQDGFYTKGQGNIIEYVTYTGEASQLVSGFGSIYVADVVADRIYFRTYSDDGLTQLWRAYLNGEQAVRLA